MMRLKILVITMCVISVMGTSALAQEQKLMNVLVKEAQLRAAPSPLGKIVATVPYTTQVEVLEKQGAWIKVKTVETATEGWMHNSALTKREFTKKSGSKDVEQIASSSELALAGKMFNKDVENKFKAGGANLNYAAVDKMEKRVVSQARIVEFVKQGELFPEGGAQ